jgi:hypothetical protein
MNTRRIAHEFCKYISIMNHEQITINKNTFERLITEANGYNPMFVRLLDCRSKQDLNNNYYNAVG